MFYISLIRVRLEYWLSILGGLRCTQRRRANDWIENEWVNQSTEMCGHEWRRLTNIVGNTNGDNDNDNYARDLTWLYGFITKCSVCSWACRCNWNWPPFHRSECFHSACSMAESKYLTLNSDPKKRGEKEEEKIAWAETHANPILEYRQWIKYVYIHPMCNDNDNVIH